MKKYRIVRRNLPDEIENSYHPRRYIIEERYTLLFGLISWWDFPSFAPPFFFETPDAAFAKIVEERGADWEHIDFVCELKQEDE